ncbi:MAG: hypothetical protein J7623_29425 [Chitinophaga sp.]|uniref:hypothetical protein n=1 Tax=Chitinophaga sp. TaxID=1869181 RepID=UPI001B1DED48|nr:hypothetical protein [Chitinophaga sp.]MBO9732800.1 hypothetical protein [Chitinophaga sp.]
MKNTQLLFLIAIVFAGCTSTNLISSWKDPALQPQKFSKILVIGMAGSKDRDIRENLENAMSQQLTANGMSAATATSIFGPKTFENLSEAEAVNQISDKGFDGVMILSLLDKNKERYYSPGRMSYTPFAMVRSHWYPYYRVIYNRTYTPGYYNTSVDYTLEANLYSSKGETLDYSAQAKTFDPSNASALATSFSKTVIADMLKKGVITK